MVNSKSKVMWKETEGENGLKMIQNCLKLKSYYANDPWGTKNHLRNFFSYEVKNLSLWSKPKWKLPKNQNFAKHIKENYYKWFASFR